MRAGIVRGVTQWPLMLLLAVVVAALSIATLPPAGRYPLFATLDAGAAAALVLPIVAAGAAVAAARLRGAGVFRHRMTARHALVQWAFCTLPAAGVGAVTLVVAAVAHAARGGSLALPAPEVLAPRLALCLLVAALGALLGRLLPLLFALPAAVALGFWAFVLPNPMTDGPLRLMAGLPVRCCAPVVDLTTGAWVAHLLAVLGALSVLLALWCALDRAVVSGLVLAVAAAVSLGAAWSAAHSVPGHGLAVRDDAVRCQQVQEGTRAMDLCLWPESEDLRPQVEQDLREVLTIAERHQVPTPAGISESLADLPAGHTQAILGEHDAMGRRMALAFALAPRQGCGTAWNPFGDWGSTEAEAPAPSLPDLAEVGAWWAEQLGLPLDPEEPTPFEGASDQEVRQRITRVMESLACAG